MLPLLPKLISNVKNVTERAVVDVSALLRPEAEKDLGGGMVQEERTFADKILGRSTITRREPTVAAKPEKPYKIPTRNIGFDDEDVEELKHIIYSEISNRSPEKQKLEARVLINTALNRMEQYRERGKELTLREVLRQPNQYQGYMPDDPESQYNVSRTGKGSPEKQAVIEEVLKELTAGEFEDNTNGAVFYIHNDDGSIEYDDTKKLYAGAQPGWVRFEDGSMGYRRDMSKDSIQKYTWGDRLANAVEKVKKTVPFLESNFEKAIKQSVTEAFPFTDRAKGLLAEVNIRDKSDKILSPFFKEPLKDVDTYSSGGEHGGAPAAVYRPVRDKKTLDVIRKLKLGGVLQKLPLKYRSALDGEEIQLDDIAPPVAAHELTHAIFRRLDIEPNSFLSDWDKAKKEPKAAQLLDYIEEHMDNTGYEVDGYDRANEYFAYLMEYAGTEGLSGLPPELRKYYEGVLEEDWGARQGTRRGEDIDLGA